jgi:hypothetical protein
MSKAKNNTITNAIKPESEEQLIHRSPDELKPYPGNARKHDEKQLTALTTSVSVKVITIINS